MQIRSVRNCTYWLVSELQYVHMTSLMPRRTSYSGPARLPWSAWRNSYASHPASGWQLSQRTCTRPTPGGPAPLVVTFKAGPVSLAPQPCPTLVTDAAPRPTDSAAAISSSCATVSIARQVPGPRPWRLPSCEIWFLSKFQVFCPSLRVAARGPPTRAGSLSQT